MLSTGDENRHGLAAGSVIDVDGRPSGRKARPADHGQVRISIRHRAEPPRSQGLNEIAGNHIEGTARVAEVKARAAVRETSAVLHVRIVARPY